MFWEHPGQSTGPTGGSRDKGEWELIVSGSNYLLTGMEKQELEQT